MLCCFVSRIFYNTETGVMLRGMQSRNKGQSVLTGWTTYLWFNQERFEDVSSMLCLKCSTVWLPTEKLKRCLLQSDTETTTFTEVALVIFFPLNHFLSSSSILTVTQLTAFPGVVFCPYTWLLFLIWTFSTQRNNVKPLTSLTLPSVIIILIL